MMFEVVPVMFVQFCDLEFIYMIQNYKLVLMHFTMYTSYINTLYISWEILL